MENQQPRIELIEQTTLLGINVETSLYADKTSVLWQSFMPRVKEIDNRIGNEFYSLQIYPDSFMQGIFTPDTMFTKWAAVKVNKKTLIPDGMELLKIPRSKYAVFLHKGVASNFPSLANYIYSLWIPTSAYTLDDRPHFEIMGDRYLGHLDPKSEEEVWIPIK